MDLEGRFTTPESLADVMRRICTESLSGTLTIRSGAASLASFSFFRGQLTGSENPDRHRRLGRILLNRGLIDRATLEESLGYQRDFASGTPIGRVLVHRGKLSQEDLREAVKTQITDELSSALGVSEGFFVFQEIQPGEEDTPLVRLDTDVIVKETLSRHSEWERIREKVPDDSVIPNVVKLGCPTDREVLHLNTNEWHVLSLVNGYYDVGCISARSGLGRFETYKVLESLLANGVIDLRRPVEPMVGIAQESHGEVVPDADQKNRAAGSSSTRWGNIISRLREESENPSKADTHSLEFESPVPFLTDICNRMTDKLMLNPDFVLDPSDEKLAERLWRQILMTFPKADLVSAKMNLLDSASFDRYTRTLGVDGPMRSIYLDTLDALGRYLRMLYLLSAQRLGSRAARALFVAVMDNVKNRSTIANSDDFFFKDMAAEILA